MRLPVLAQSEVVGKVVAIQDGDTITLLDLDLAQHRVRISGIDAPEKGQSFGHVSATHLSALAFNRLASAHCHKVDRKRSIDRVLAG
jgi:endonuclease YncB( thermonuclease family)